MSQIVNIKQAYEQETAEDGYRVYIDRLWPRGLSHQTFHYDLWEKEIAPSTQLREWFHGNPAARWQQFQAQYKAELEQNPSFAKFKESLKDKPVITLLYSSHDRVRNNAVVVAALLRE